MSASALITIIVVMIAGVLIAMEVGINLLENKVARDRELAKINKHLGSLEASPSPPASVDMILRFDYTLDECVDAARRGIERFKTYRSWRWRDLVFSVLTTWLFSFLPLYLALRALASEQLGLLVGVASGTVIAVMSGMLFPALHASSFDRRLRKLYREKLGSEGPFACEVELTPMALNVRDFNTQVAIEWEGIEEVVLTGDSVDVFTRTGGCLVVRDRAFASANEKQRFADLAAGYTELARAGTEATARTT